MTSLGDRIREFLDDEAEARLRTYYKEKPGRRFDTLAGGGDRTESRNVFTSDDIVAVSLLGVNIPGRAALELLDLDMERAPGLSAIPHNKDLWGVPDFTVAPDGIADQIWHRLEAIEGIGWVTAGKLLARKRPRLIPVFDSVVKAALMPHHSDRWWVSLQQALVDDPGIVARLRELKKNTKLPKEVSLLRVLDVSVWMTSQVA